MQFDDIRDCFTADTIIRYALVSAVCISAGAVLLLAMFLLAKIPGRGTGLFHLLQNAGIFFMFSAMMAAYAAIHRGNSPDGERATIPLIAFAARKAPVIMAAILVSILAILAVALAETLVSFIGYVPYAGPVIVVLLTLPFFVLNAAAITAAVFVWVAVPPLAAEGTDVRRMPRVLLSIVRRRGLLLIGYVFAALAALAVMVGPLLMILRYAAGITRAAQWNIAPAYPGFFKTLVRPSYITDIIGRIAPRPDAAAALREYGTGVFSYVDMLGVALKAMFGVAAVAVAAIVLALFFNLLSFLFARAKRGL